MPFTIGLVLALLFLLSAPPPPASAQFPRRKPTPHDTLISPEVLSDRRVAFRIYAPKASEVTLRGDWMEAPEPVTQKKGTLASPATARAMSVFPVPGAPTISTPRGPRAPTSEI